MFTWAKGATKAFLFGETLLKYLLIFFFICSPIVSRAATPTKLVFYKTSPLMITSLVVVDDTSTIKDFMSKMPTEPPPLSEPPLGCLSTDYMEAFYPDTVDFYDFCPHYFVIAKMTDEFYTEYTWLLKERKGMKIMDWTKLTKFEQLPGLLNQARMLIAVFNKKSGVIPLEFIVTILVDSSGEALAVDDLMLKSSHRKGKGLQTNLVPYSVRRNLNKLHFSPIGYLGKHEVCRIPVKFELRNDHLVAVKVTDQLR
ncbi:MAG: hypothetical protein KAH24_07080 [Holophagae bacterium]|nr:hypothetical protein [Holophagae bacterium]